MILNQADSMEKLIESPHLEARSQQLRAQAKLTFGYRDEAIRAYQHSKQLGAGNRWTAILEAALREGK